MGPDEANGTESGAPQFVVTTDDAAELVEVHTEDSAHSSAGAKEISGIGNAGKTVPSRGFPPFKLFELQHFDGSHLPENLPSECEHLDDAERRVLGLPFDQAYQEQQTRATTP